MKLLLKIFLITCFPAMLMAQDTTVVKAQASKVAQALVTGNYKIVVDNMHPKGIQLAGTKEKMLQVLTASITDLKTKGLIKIEAASIGSPGKFYKAGKEIHCLIPETTTLRMTTGRIVMHNYLLAISGDGGKKWTFLDINSSTYNKVPQLFPDFNKDLIIPEPKQPDYFKD